MAYLNFSTDSTVSEDAGIESRINAEFLLKVLELRNNHVTFILQHLKGTKPENFVFDCFISPNLGG
jgi:hypothetical protein